MFITCTTNHLLHIRLTHYELRFTVHSSRLDQLHAKMLAAMNNADYTQVIQFIKGLYLFVELEDQQIAEIATWFTPLQVPEGQRLYSPGDAGEYFYVIQRGSVAITRLIAGEEEDTDILEAGDFFGEAALLENRARSTSATTVTPATLLRLDSERFFRLLRDYPLVKANLERAAQTERIIRRRRFAWLGEDEVIYQIARKDEVILAFYLIIPVLLGISSLVLLFQATAVEPATVAWWGWLALASAFAAGAILWGIWSWIDWANDYYIVTDQRAVWIERVIFLYESREEAPLSTILAVNMRTSFLGRILGYGDVIVRTFTGQVAFRNVSDPRLMADAVEQYWHRAQERSEQEEAERMERAIRQHLGIGERQQRALLGSGGAAAESAARERGSGGAAAESAARAVGPQSPEEPPPAAGAGFFDRLFGDLFTVRIEEGDTITYRKYWTVLVRKVWIPSLGILGAAAMMVAYGIFYFLGYISFPSPLITLPGGFLLILGLLPWWLYQYIDWRNDIYQVTDRHIFDIERRPLGTEVRKSAPLESILSLEHRRVGLLGYLLNYGNVTINVGETRFVFVGVFDPARAQQDIFNRMHALRRRKQEAEAARERERIAEAITMYHRNVEDIRQRRSPFDSGLG